MVSLHKVTYLSKTNKQTNKVPLNLVNNLQYHGEEHNYAHKPSFHVFEKRCYMSIKLKRVPFDRYQNFRVSLHFIKLKILLRFIKINVISYYKS